MIWAFQKVLSRRLLLWATFSPLVGLPLLFNGSPFGHGFGIQALL